tara:strand:+ start:86845 stop:87078 length:234 start_codon:yes stop_codon:yes gene_type:complete
VKVKIELKKGETKEEAEELLFKALDLHRTGEIHTRESFEDPAMLDISQRVAKVQEDIHAEMMAEIFEALDGEYNGHE